LQVHIIMSSRFKGAIEAECESCELQEQMRMSLRVLGTTEDELEMLKELLRKSLRC
jgi:hypothetical protein